MNCNGVSPPYGKIEHGRLEDGAIAPVFIVDAAFV
jgi:hypothetical protein